MRPVPLAGGILALSWLSPAVAAELFTPEQRTAIIQIVREALKQEPSILREAVDALQADEARLNEDKARAAITANHTALSDPADPVAGNPNSSVTIVEFFDPR